MNKEPRRIFISEEREIEEKKKYKYTELYIYDPDFLAEYKQQIINSFSDNLDLQRRVEMNMSDITEVVIGDRVKSGQSRLILTNKQIHLDSGYVDITDNSFTLKPGTEYIETNLIRTLLYAASRKKGLTGIIDYERDESGKVIGRKNTGLNGGIAQYLAEKITGKAVPVEEDCYAFNKEIVSLLSDVLGEDLIKTAFYENPSALRDTLNSIAGDSEFYDKFNRDLDTINKLQETVRRLKSGVITSKDPETVTKMETVLKLQQEKVVESVFANIVIPTIQRQDNGVRIEKTGALFSKHEQLLNPVAKYHYNDWSSDQILKIIQNELKNNPINFTEIQEVVKTIDTNKRISKAKAGQSIDAVENFYSANEEVLKVDRSTTLTPLLKSELAGMVDILDKYEETAAMSNLESVNSNLEDYKKFLKKYFYKIPNLEEEIEKIRQEKNEKAKNDPTKQPKAVEDAKEAGRKKAEEILNKPSDPTKKTQEQTTPDSKQDKPHPNLNDNYVIDSLTGQVYSQQNKTIFEKAITISKATGKPVPLDDEVLETLKKDALDEYKEKLEKMEPSASLLACYGDKWKDVLLEAYTEGWNRGISSVVSQATQKGIEERKEIIDDLKKGKLPKEPKEPISLEEIETVYRETTKIVDEKGNEVIINKNTNQPIMSDRTKNIAEFAEKWVKINGENSFSKEAETTYNSIQDEIVKKDGTLDIEKITKVTEKKEEKNQNIVEEKFEQTPHNEKIEKKSEGMVALPKKPLAQVLQDIPNASKEEIEEQLNIYNGEPIILPDKSVYHPFNDPLAAGKLNARYRELNNGEDHPRFVAEAPNAIAALLDKEDFLIEQGGYEPAYFENIRIIKADIESRHPELVSQETVTKTEHK